PADEPGLLRYPAEATAALDLATGLLDLGGQRGWVARLLDEALGGQDATDGPLLAGLREYLLARRQRETLAREDRGLVPGSAPPPGDAAQPGFAAAAWQGLRKAARLQEQCDAHPWVGPILDSFLAPAGGASPERTLDELESALGRCPLVRAILKTL